MTNLPAHWATAMLEELVAPDGVFSDGDWVESKDQDPNGSIRLLQLADVGDGVFLNRSNRFINDRQFDTLQCTEVQPDDLLVARMPDPLGRCCQAPRLPTRCVTVVDVAIIRLGTSSVSSKWLMHLLNSPPVRQAIELQSSGTTRRRISRTNLGRLELPVPPIGEQVRIAAKLDTILGRIAACRTRLDAIRERMARFVHSVLSSATTGDLTREWRSGRRIPLEWARTSLGTLLEDSRYGTSKRCSIEPLGTPVLRIPNIARGAVTQNELKYAALEERELQKLALQPGDILMIRSNGSLGLVGRTAVASDRERGYAFAGYLIRLRVDSSRVRPGYVSLCLSSPESRSEIETVARSTNGINNINIREVSALSIYLPTLEEQDAVLQRVAELLALSDAVIAHVDGCMAMLDGVVRTALGAAARGLLVLPSSDDGTAAALISDLRSRRSTNGRTRRARRSRDRQQDAEVVLVRRDNVGHGHLSDILRRSGQLSAEALWTASALTIDDFYEQLKDEEARGLLREVVGKANGHARRLEACS